MNTLLIFFALFQFCAAAEETRQYIEIEETWDGRRVLKRRVRQAEFDEEEGSGSPDLPSPVERLDVFVRVEMNTRIPFSQGLKNKESEEYLLKKAELLEELRIKLENVASIEDADLLFASIDVDFEETSGELRQSTSPSMKAIITIPFKVDSTEMLSDEVEQQLEDQLRETTITTLNDMVEDGLPEDSLLSSDPDFRFSSSRQSIDLTRWNGASPSKISLSFICLIIINFLF